MLYSAAASELLPPHLRINETHPCVRFAAIDEDGDLTFNASAGEGSSYNRNFSRDGMLAGMIAGDPVVLEAQLHISFKHQAHAEDSSTGALPWRVHHEMPGVRLPGREVSTDYSAADVTALTLIAAEGLLKLDRPRGETLVADFRQNLEGALANIQAQTGEDGIFREYVPQGGTQHGTKVTIWKDSELHGPNGQEEPDYGDGVAYGQLQFIVARAFLSASRIFNRPDLARQADHMYHVGITTFMQQPEGFLVYRDRKDELVMPTSDAWFSLAFIPTEYATRIPWRNIEEQTRQLETNYGHTCAPLALSKDWSDGYHGPKVWVFENDIIYEAAIKFYMHRRAAVAARVAPFIGRGWELLGITEHDGQQDARYEGNREQFWSAMAACNFAGKVANPLHTWL